MLVIPALRESGRNIKEFEANLAYTVRPCLQKFFKYILKRVRYTNKVVMSGRNT